jgi:ribonuclease P protein component
MPDRLSYRLKSKKDIDEIYSEGKTIHSSDGCVKAVYKSYENHDDPKVIFTVAVHKKAGIAVWRNRAKRLLRESYRQKKNTLIDYCKENNLLIKIIFSLNHINQNNYKKVSLKHILPGIDEILNKISKKT